MNPIVAGQAFSAPPQWARLMRTLFDRLPGTIPKILERYARPDGSLLWPTTPNHSDIDALDDAYESFHNWPLFHLLGGASSVQDAAEREFEAITKQFTRYDCGYGHPVVVNEYEQGYDWFHQGEGYLFFYHLCAARPSHANNRTRAERYAGFLLSENSPTANYDPALHILRCPHIGSMGPAFRNFEPKPCHYGGWRNYYGLPFQEFPDCVDPESYFSSRENALKLGEILSRRLGRGDVAMNLASTSMATNAYLATGETRFRDWVLEYIEAWMRRASTNGGLIPDNVGLSGAVGEYTNGKWYGGNYGWTWPHGWVSVGDAVGIAFQNATLLTGDSSYAGFYRTHLERLAELGINREGTLHTPYKFGDPGWYGYKIDNPHILKDDRGHVLWQDGAFEFQPMSAVYPAKLWEMTHSDSDWGLVRLFRDHYQNNWTQVLEVPSKDLGGHEAAWMGYLHGEFPDYPEKILQHNLDQLQQRLDFMANDTQDPMTYTDSYLQKRNPFSMEGLVQLTMGGTPPIYNGGLLQTRLRHFDPHNRQPGLPPDTAALVENLDGKSVTLALVNLHRNKPRTLLIQAGSFGEHSFEEVEVLGQSDPTSHVGGPHVSVTLLPSSAARLRLTIKRYCRQPSLRMPWDG